MVSPVKPLVAMWRKPETRRNVGFSFFAVVGLGMGVAFGSWTRACAGTSCPSISHLETWQPEQSAKFYAADVRLIHQLVGQLVRLTHLTPVTHAPPTWRPRSGG